MQITLVLTHRCNLACSYCYAGEKFNRSMSVATGCRALEMAFREAGPGEPVTVAFFGGEPMLEFPLMVQLARTARRLGWAHQRPVQFTVTTNATVLSERHLRFLYTYDFDVALSVDGLLEGNRHRPFATGKSSTEVVWENIARAARTLEKMTVMMVVSPDTVSDLPRTVAGLRALGVPNMALLPNVDVAWEDSAWDEAEHVFGDLAGWCRASLSEARPLMLRPFIDRLQPTRASARCGFGNRELAVSPAGNLYPCARLVGTDSRPEVRVGNVSCGLDADRLEAVQTQSRTRLSSCGVDGPCGCVPLMPGTRMERQLAHYKRFGEVVERAVRDVAISEPALAGVR